VTPLRFSGIRPISRKLPTLRDWDRVAIDFAETYTSHLDLRARPMKRRIASIALFATLLSGAAWPLLATPAPPISGVVRHLEAPVPGVLVIFYNLGDNSLSRITTASDGTFVLPSAPAGVYDLIAYKRGFEPAMQRLWHQGAAEQVSAVSIELTRKGGVVTPAKTPAPATIWDLRDRLPADVLRELDIESEAPRPDSTPPVAAATSNVNLSKTLAGEVSTVTDVASGSVGSALSRAAVGLHGGLPNGWQYGISGDYSTLGNADEPGETTTGNAAGLALDVSPTDAQKLRLSTRRNTLSFGDSPATLQSHAVSWSRGAEKGLVEAVAARYVEETNLYRATALGTTIFPVASRTWEINGRYGRPASDTPGVGVSMTYRHKEATVGPSGVGAQGAFFQAAPDADLAASTAVRVGEHAEVEGGVIARYLGTSGSAYGIAPALTARYTVGGTMVYVRGLYRVAGSTQGAATVMPRVASIEDSQEPAATQALAAGVQYQTGRDTTLSFEASEQRMGELVRAFFEGDFLTDFDSVYLLDGNSVRQYKATLQHRLTDTLSGSVSVRYGAIDGAVTPQSAAAYGIESNSGRYWSARAAVEVLPTRTGIAVIVRGIRQQLDTPAAALANDSDKLALSVAQDLSVIGLTPFGADWKLLLALEQAHGATISDPQDESATANRLMGGVAVAF
jgi:Carboxypeptidase regulatory-like domain